MVYNREAAAPGSRISSPRSWPGTELSIIKISEETGGAGRRLTRKSYRGPKRGPEKSIHNSAAIPAAGKNDAKQRSHEFFLEIYAAISFYLSIFGVLWILLSY